MSDSIAECSRHNLPMGHPRPDSAGGVYVVACEHMDKKFIVAIEGTSYRFVDFVKDKDDGDVSVEEIAALKVPVDDGEAITEWDRARGILLSGRDPRRALDG